MTRPRTHAPGSSRHSAQSCRTALLVRRRPKSGVMPRETHTFSAHVDLGTLTRVDLGQIGAVGGRDRRADRTVALSYTGVVTQTACWEERSEVCDEIRLTLAEVRRRTPSAEPAWGPRGTTPRLTVRGTTAGAPPPPPPPPPHCPRAVGSATPAKHCLTAWGQWAVDPPQCTAPLPGGSGQCNSCNALTASLPRGSGQCNLCNALPHCPGAARSAPPAMHCLTAWGQWTVQLLQCTASLPRGSGQWNSCNALPHCPWAVGSATPAMHCLTAWGQWAVQLLKCTASVPWGQWAVQLLQCTA